MIEKPNGNTSGNGSDMKRKTRRKYGADTEAGIAYREQLAEDRANQAAADKKLNKKLMIISAGLCALVLAINIPMIVSKSKNLSLLTQTAISRQAELKDIEDNPRHEVVRKEADVINAHDVMQYVCDAQNKLSAYIFDETKADSSMSKEHIDLLEEYNKFCENTQLEPDRIDTTWLGSVLSNENVKTSTITAMPYTWVCDNDYDLVGVEVKVSWRCYLNYDSPNPDLVAVIMARYNSEMNIFSQFETYFVDDYDQYFANNQIAEEGN